MTSEPKYKLSLEVAESIERHFIMQFEKAKVHGTDELAPVPQAKIITVLINAAFWASLGKEEGHSPKISLALLPPGETDRMLMFEEQIPFTSSNLTKLAPAVANPGVHLGIWYSEGELFIWGTTLHLPAACFVLQVLEPGLLVIKHRRISGLGKFVNVAVLTGDQVKIIDQESSSLANCPALLQSLLGMPLHSFSDDSVNVLVELAIAMRAHGRGGLLLVVPKNTERWKASIIHPISHQVTPPFRGISTLMGNNSATNDDDSWLQTLRKHVYYIGGFTAVDGATIVNTDHELVAFGAKISRSAENGHVNKIIVTEPVAGGKASVIHPAQHGGTRHLAAAQFVYDQHDSLALVASQDGKFTVFAWSSQLEMVHAHRIDSLLL